MLEQTKAAKRRVQERDPQTGLFPFIDTYFVGDGIDIGAGQDCLAKNQTMFPNMTSVLSWDRPQGDAQYLLSIPDQQFDFVHSSHCLEHMVDPQTALVSWIRVCKSGGYLVLTVPDEILYEHGKWPSQYNNDHKWSFTLRPTSSMPRSIRVQDLIDHFSVDIIRLQLIDKGYNPNALGDQTISVNGPECSIEMIMRRI